MSSVLIPPVVLVDTHNVKVLSRQVLVWKLVENYPHRPFEWVQETGVLGHLQGTQWIIFKFDILPNLQ